MNNEKGDIIKAPATAPRTCFPEQGSSGSSAANQRKLPLRPVPASPRFITRPNSLRQFGNCHKELGDPALRLFTRNSFCFLTAAGCPRDVTEPSTSRPLGTICRPRRAVDQSFPLVTTREILRQQLRPAVSSGRRRAVEILAPRSVRDDANSKRCYASPGRGGFLTAWHWACLIPRPALQPALRRRKSRCVTAAYPVLRDLVSSSFCSDQRKEFCAGHGGNARSPQEYPSRLR